VPGPPPRAVERKIGVEVRVDGATLYPAYDCRAELTRVACPTWVAVGRHDWICPVDQAEEIHTLIPHSTLTVFERSGPSPQVEEREAFTRELAAFFAGLTA